MPISTMSRMSGPSISSPSVVVGRFGGHRDVVWMAFFQARCCDPDELGPLQRLDGVGAGVAHRSSQSTGELMDHRRQRPTEGYPTFDALGHQLVLGERVVGEVAVLRIRLGRFP